MLPGAQSFVRYVAPGLRRDRSAAFRRHLGPRAPLKEGRQSRDPMAASGLADSDVDTPDLDSLQVRQPLP